MSNRYVRRASCVILTAWLGLAAGCATRPDIVGHNSDAEEWAETQKHDPQDKTKDWPGAHPPQAARPDTPKPPPASAPASH
jgi:hypothetical protein